MADYTQEQLIARIAELEKAVQYLSQSQSDMAEQINTLNQFVSAITESQTFEKSMATIESMGKQVLDCDSATFWCYDGAENKYFSNDENRGGRDWQIAEQNMRTAAEKRDVFITNNTAYIPVISNDKVSGVLVASGKDGGFDKESLDKFAPNGQIANTIELSLKKEFEHQGRITDELTRLKNRQGVKEYVNNTLIPTINEKKDVCIIMCDIDHFKKINDTYGHDAGDTVLKNVANILHSGARQGADSAFRWGGEEMICVLNCDPAQAFDIAECLRNQIENTQHLVYNSDKQPENVSVTISMGIHHMTTKTNEELTPENAFQFFESQLKCADELAYAAKESGRNVVIGSTEMQKNYAMYKATEFLTDKEMSYEEKDAISNVIANAIESNNYEIVIEALENKADNTPNVAENISAFIAKLEKLSDNTAIEKKETEEVQEKATNSENNKSKSTTVFNNLTTYSDIDNKTYINTDAHTAYDISKMAQSENIPHSVKYEGDKSAVTLDGVQNKLFIDTIKNMENWADKVNVKVAEQKKEKSESVHNQEER